MGKQPTERDFQRWVTARFEQAGVWCDSFHPGIGTNPGVFDMWVDTDAFGSVPVELKVGTAHDADGILWTEQVRPSQIQWSYRRAKYGLPSFVLVGSWAADHWRVFAIDAIYLSKWEEGFEIGLEAIELEPSFFAGEFENFCDDALDMAA